MLAVYEAALVAVAWWLAVAVVNRPWERVAVTDLVLDLAEGAGAAARLARALGDPTLRVVEGDGAASGIGSRTLVYREGTPVAALLHDPSLAVDPSLQEAVSAVSVLTAAHGRLEVDVRIGLEEVSAPASPAGPAEGERRRLELELREHVGASLVALRGRLAACGDDPEVMRLVGQATRRIELALGDLDAVARGLHPRALSEGGLAGGLHDLAATSTSDVLVNVELPRLPEEVEATAYYVCAEAVANAAKYAQARLVTIDAAANDGSLRLIVCDDGVGGARVVRGGGLQGLHDRVEAVGGELSIESPEGGGTRITMELAW